MTLYEFLDESKLCLQVRRSPLSKMPFTASIEDIFLITGSSGVHFYGYGNSIDEAIKDYVRKIEGKLLRYYASEYLSRDVRVPDMLTV